MIEIFGLKLIDTEGFLELLIRFTFNLAVLIVIIRYLYYSVAKRKDYMFSHLMIGCIVFLLCFMLGNVKLQLGLALGLFAVFGIIRYRTDPIPIKEMTYLFIIIGISVINAMANKKISYAEILFTNLIIIGIVFGLEKIWLLRHESSKNVTYEKIELIKPEKRQLLLKDLEERTGIKINRIEIGRINFLRDSVRIRIYYYADDNEINLADDEGTRSADNDD